MAKKSNIIKQRVLKKKIRKFSFGITDVLINMVLYYLYFTFSVSGKSGSMGVHRKFDMADELIEEFDAKRIRKALSNLKQKGFIQTFKNQINLPRITKAGLDRIQNIFPEYDKNRYWDKKLYVVNYDIPVKFNRDRDILRENLERFKAVSLQKSVYLTPYNPREIIKIITHKYNLGGQILISTLDPADAFGNIEIKDFLWDIYKLDSVNEDYKWFIESHRSFDFSKAKKTRMQIVFTYLSVLRNDPQLPFDLLKDEYLGDEAYLLFKKLTKV